MYSKMLPLTEGRMEKELTINETYRFKEAPFHSVIKAMVPKKAVMRNKSAAMTTLCLSGAHAHTRGCKNLSREYWMGCGGAVRRRSSGAGRRAA